MENESAYFEVRPAASGHWKVDRRFVPLLQQLTVPSRPGQTVVGFAAETNDLVANATAKLEKKGADLVVANDVAAPGAGFEHDTNAVTIVTSAGTTHQVALSDKRAVARAVIDAVVQHRSTS